MKILFIVQDMFIYKGISAGASALIQSHLELLIANGYEVDVLIISDKATSEEHLSIDFSRYSIKPDLIKLSSVSAPRFMGFITLVKDPEALINPFINDANIKQLRVYLMNTEPELIWAEHLLPALLMCRARTKVPIVYSHHDWAWLIHKHRKLVQKNLKSQIINRRLKFTEEKLVNNVSGCVTGSWTDKEKMRQIGAKKVGYFPTTYESVQLSEPGQIVELPRIVHLGGMNTTANRLGLERFMKVVWPDLCEKIGYAPELWIIGDLTLASTQLRIDLENAEATCTGFVDDLSSVLRPYDIHIIPWEFDTGTRTRLPLVFNYSQVLVATKASVACYHNQLEEMQNCALVNDLTGMALIISKLYFDSELRMNIGDQAKRTFAKEFTIYSQLIDISSFIDGLV